MKETLRSVVSTVTASKDGSATSVADLFTGSGKTAKKGRDKLGSGDGSSKAILYASFQNRADAAKRAYAASSTTGWIDLPNQTLVLSKE